MKLPKIPKTMKVDAIRIWKDRVRVELSKTVDGVHVTGCTDADITTVMTCTDRLKQDDEVTELDSITLSYNMVPFAKDIDHFHLRINQKGKVLIVYFTHGGQLLFEENNQSDIWYHHTTKKESN
jgi:hypothetical protein